MPKRFQSGFTLIELAIVLVIIGLITGGVLVGRDMIRTAQLLKVAKDLEKYQTAVNTFRDKYSGLPGNIANATQFFTAYSACPFTDNSNGVTPTATCNGSGNGTIGYSAASNQGFEVYQVFQQLALAHLVPGAYTPEYYGVAPGVPAPIIGPNEQLGGMVCIMYDYGQLQGDYGGSAATVGRHVFLLGAGIPLCASFGASGLAPIFTPVQAAYLDKKYDDGLPNSGKITGPQTYDAGIQGCGSTAYRNVDYVGGDWVNLPGAGCVLFWNAGF